VSDNGQIHNAEQGHGDIGDDAWKGDSKYLAVHDYR
jgi:hypothetical protein